MNLSEDNYTVGLTTHKSEKVRDKQDLAQNAVQFCYVGNIDQSVKPRSKNNFWWYRVDGSLVDLPLSTDVAKVPLFRAFEVIMASWDAYLENVRFRSDYIHQKLDWVADCYATYIAWCLQKELNIWSRKHPAFKTTDSLWWEAGGELYAATWEACAFLYDYLPEGSLPYRDAVEHWSNIVFDDIQNTYKKSWDRSKNKELGDMRNTLSTMKGWENPFDDSQPHHYNLHQAIIQIASPNSKWHSQSREKKNARRKFIEGPWRRYKKAYADVIRGLDKGILIKGKRIRGALVRESNDNLYQAIPGKRIKYIYKRKDNSMLTSRGKYKRGP